MNETGTAAHSWDHNTWKMEEGILMQVLNQQELHDASLFKRVEEEMRVLLSVKNQK